MEIFNSVMLFSVCLQYLLVIVYFSVARGMGELDIHQPEPAPGEVLDDNIPYLLLDVRDDDDFNMCHIISGKLGALGNILFHKLFHKYNGTVQSVVMEVIISK